MEEAAARCPSPYLVRFQNQELSQDLKTTRNQIVNFVHAHDNVVVEEDDENAKIEKLREELDRLERNRAEKTELREQDLAKLEQQAATLFKAEQGVAESLATFELKLRQECDKLQQSLDQSQLQLRNIQQEIKSKRDARDKYRKDLKITDDSIEKLRNLIQKENNTCSQGSVKVLEEDRDLGRASFVSVIEVNERLTKEENSARNLWDICKENEKDVVIQCGHRMCKSCLDSWCSRSPNYQLCPFCKLPIQTVTRCFN